MKPPECIVFDSAALLPNAWSHFATQGPVRAFNPGLLRDDDGWILAYRVVGADTLRRIALCRLDREFRIVPGSPLALTDLLRFPTGRSYDAPEATNWFADPRLYRFAGRIFVYWNSGWHEPRNYQFLQELDPAHLRPIGSPRELILRGERQKLEKNWTLFGDGPFHAIYSPHPQRVLAFSLAGQGDIEFSETHSTMWQHTGYDQTHGGLRGGAPPQRLGDHYYSFCHSVHDAPDGFRYAPTVYRFSAKAPFAPTDVPHTALNLGHPFGARRVHPKLNPAVGEVVYPCGAAHDNGRWIVSFGINDEHCALTVLSPGEVLATLRPLAPQP